MASLTGQQINNTYQGLLKTTDNAALPAGRIAITDGTGVESGLFFQKEYNTIGVSGTALPNEGAYLELQNNGFTGGLSPMGTGFETAMWFTDVNGAPTYRLQQDSSGDIKYVQGKGGSKHVFTGGSITIGNNASTSNSDNWFTGYQQSVTDLQIAGQDLTLTRQGTTPLTVTIPSGVSSIIAGTGITVDQATGDVTVSSSGGGAAGLVSGTGTDSMKSADTLTTNAASAPTTNSIAIGNGATIAPADPARPTWELGHIAIGENVNITENSFGNFYSRSCIAIGKNAQVNPYYDGGNIAIGDGANSSNMHGISIGANSNAFQFAVSMGQNSNAAAESSFALGRNASAQKLNSVGIGASTFANGVNSIAIGQGATAEADTSITIGDGNTNQNGPNLSIGRGNNNLAAGSTIIGQGNNMGLNNAGCQLFASNITVPAGQNDFVGIGRINNPIGSISNTIQIGLVSQVTDSANSVAIGRGSSVINANNSVAIGRDASATVGQSTAVGYQVTATRANFVTVNELELKTVGGGIIMPSPDGTLYKVTVTNAGALTVSLA
tara:strand:+ start:2366 stop:4024 length:1659 start_codon:yes stop_codon:yes gene_type:complete